MVVTAEKPIDFELLLLALMMLKAGLGMLTGRVRECTILVVVLILAVEGFPVRRVMRKVFIRVGAVELSTIRLMV